MRTSQHGAVLIRPARPADADDVYRLETASFAIEGERFNKRQVRYLIGGARGVALVAEAGGEVMGWAVGLIRRSGRKKKRNVGGRVYALAVHPDARGLRIGQRLLGQLLEELAGRGARRVWLEVRKGNEAAIELYRKHGFVEDRHLAHYYQRGVHGLRMVREMRVGG